MLRKAIVLGLAVAAISGTVASGTVAFADGGLGGPAGGGLIGSLHPYREIQIESDPPGALVWIDGRRFGTTPQAIRVDDQRPTIHVILIKPGYLDTVGEVDLTNLTEPVVHADLIPKY